MIFNLSMTSLRIVRLLSIIFLLHFEGGFLKAVTENPPNIVFIMTDDQAYDAIGNGERLPFLKMPNLDRLKKSGIEFKNAFVTTSLCSPSRASIMTGVYAHEHGVLHHSPCIDPRENDVLLGQYLQKGGYKTGFVGKWHMKETDAPRRGFDHWYSFEGQGHYWNPTINSNGERSVVKGYITDLLTQESVRFIEKNKENPFCLFLWHKAPHEPLMPNIGYKNHYQNEKFPEPKNFKDDYATKPEFLRRGWLFGLHQKQWRESETKEIPPKIPLRQWKSDPNFYDYARVLQSVDDSVGIVLDTLEKMGLKDNTLVIFTSDNGMNLGSHNKTPIDKRLLWEESIRVPLLLSLPNKIPQGATSSSMVINLDLPATILDLAGVPIPDSYQGGSLVPMFKNPNHSIREDFMCEYFREDYAPGIPTMFGVRGKEYKYINTLNQKPNESEELYDLRSDPYELVNLAKNQNSSDLLNKARGRLKELQQELKVSPELLLGKQSP